MSRKKEEKLSIEIVVLRGLLDLEAEDKHEDTIVDIVAENSMAFLTVHGTLVSLLSLQEKQELLVYYFEHDKREFLDVNKTLLELKVENGSRIIVDTQKRTRRKRQNDGQDIDFDDEDNVEFVCITRIFESEGIPIRRTRVLAKKYHPCSMLMDDVSYLWNKNNLKFRCGRITLVPEKTFEELGICSPENEIIVTGARG